MPSCMFHYIVSSCALQPFWNFETKLFYSILFEKSKVTSALCNIIRINKTINPNDAARGNSHPYHLFKVATHVGINNHNLVKRLSTALNAFTWLKMIKFYYNNKMSFIINSN